MFHDFELMMLIGTAIIVLLTPIVVAVWALVRSYRLEREIRGLRQTLLTMRPVRATAPAPQPEAKPAQQPPAPAAAPEPEPAPVSEPAPAPQPAAKPARAGVWPRQAQDTVAADLAEETAGADADRAAAAPPPPPAAPPAAPRGERFEDRLASRWLIWLGALALALAALFLVKYAAEHGLLGPKARVALGLALGAALTLFGERLRRNPLQRQIASIRPNHLPGAFTSAGLFALFASVYAAYGLYGFIGPLTAFAGLGAISLLAFALAAIHMPIVAILGLLSGFATPLLIESEAPSPWGLFGYLAAVVAASYGVLHYRAWRWLAYLTLAGALGWVALWTSGNHHAGDILPLSVFLAFLVALVVWSALRLVPDEAPRMWSIFTGGKAVLVPEQAVWIAAVGAIILFGLMVGQETVTTAVMVLALAGAAGFIAIAYHFARYDEGFAAAGILLTVTLAAWLPWQAFRDARAELGGAANVLPAGTLVPPAIQFYFSWHLIFAAVMVAVGFGFFRRAARPALWAATSVLTAAAIVVLLYIRTKHLAADSVWIMICAGAALLALVAATQLNARRDDRQLRLSLGIYAAACIAGVGFAFAFWLENALLTVALSAMLPALAWIAAKLDLREFRLFALIIAAVVLARLALNPYVFDYAASARFGAHWVVYGYGVPAAAFYGASVLFARQGADRLVTVLQSGALAFALLLVSFEIRVFVEGDMGAPRLTGFELGLHSGVWLAAGWWRARAWAASASAFDWWWSTVLIGLGIAAVVLGQLTALNPMLTGEFIGERFLANKLLVVLLVPAVLLGLIAPVSERLFSWPHSRLAIGGLALTSLMMWLTAETKHAFQGPRLVPEMLSDGENYAYSAVWLLAAVAILLAGLFTRRAVLRYGALIILFFTVLKVFLFDMWGLGGLYRVASFLGLGLSLLAIGWLYQRFIQPPAPAAGAASGPMRGA